MLSRPFLFSAVACLPPVLFLSTCAVCHRIKDEEGNWHSPEYFSRELEVGAVKTHTICHPCLKKSYPEFWQNHAKAFKSKKADK